MRRAFFSYRLISLLLQTPPFRLHNPRHLAPFDRGLAMNRASLVNIYSYLYLFFLFLPSTLHGLDNLPPDMTGGRRSTLQQQHGYHRVSLMSCLNTGFFAGGSASNDSYISTRPHFLSLNSLSLESFHFLRRNSTLNEAGPTIHQRQTGKQGGLWNLSKH